MCTDILSLDPHIVCQSRYIIACMYIQYLDLHGIYSPTCLLRPPMGKWNICLCSQVVFIQRVSVNICQYISLANIRMDRYTRRKQVTYSVLIKFLIPKLQFTVNPLYNVGVGPSDL